MIVLLLYFLIYQVPYDHLEFDKDFLEGKTKIEQPKTAAEAAAAEETVSFIVFL